MKIVVQAWDIDGKEITYTFNAKTNWMERYNREWEYMRRMVENGDIINFVISTVKR